MEETLLKRMMPNSKEAEGAVIGSMIGPGFYRESV